jgi:hypothetical protein
MSGGVAELGHGIPETAAISSGISLRFETAVEVGSLPVVRC